VNDLDVLETNDDDLDKSLLPARNLFNDDKDIYYGCWE
jgi:hypothetical protein